MEGERTCAGQTRHDHSQQRLRPNRLPSDPSHRHNDSTSTQNMESVDSSPTTTMSTTDSASLSDPSPSSSPDSPVNLMMPTTSFSSVSFAPPAVGMVPPPLPPPLPPPTTSPAERPMTSPSPRKPRNMKGLSIHPVSLNSALVSEPSSPSFIKPKIPSMKRKPSQLSLKTNSSDLNQHHQPTLLEVPHSPGVAPIHQRRALKHSTSTPHMLSGIRSATFGPAGGMAFPTVLERNESGLSNYLRPCKPKPRLGSFDSVAIAEEESPIKAQMATCAASDFEEFREQDNEDQKTPGYPDGPICIYEPNVYLYLEPTAEEASKFDVVINVAREVTNPFMLSQPETHGAYTNDGSVSESPADGPALDADLEAVSRQTPAESPSTPKASTAPVKEPEYIHIPWDHNTDIQTDLMHLCEVMDKRRKEGKKVLVHCQQGASRSASLIIAYGIYQNPELSVNDAYYAAQARSRWISPNMRLMYCLQDFQKEVSKRRLAPGSGFKLRSGRSPTKHHRLTLSADNINLASKEPLTAPLPNGQESPKGKAEKASSRRPRGQSSPSSSGPVLSPGPLSAPSSFSWPRNQHQTDPGEFETIKIDSVSHQPSQEVERMSKVPPSCRVPPPPQPISLAHAAPNAGNAFAFMPPQLDVPLASPGFGSFDDILKPLQSPGFREHGFGRGNGFLFGSLNFGKPEGPLDPSQSMPRVLNIREPARTTSKSLCGNLNPVKVDSSALDATSVDLPLREHQVTVTRENPDDMALMSPRSETMTNNPLRGKVPPAFAGMQFIEPPPTPCHGVFSPRQTTFPRDPFYPFGRPSQSADPRSPPTKGETPIVRSIDDMI